MTSCKEGCDIDEPKVSPCPSRMSDGRAFTDYRPRCIVNADLLNSVKGTKSSYESRMYLQMNAEKLMEDERNRAISRLSPCAPCNRPKTQSGTMLPERYIVKCDNVTCTRTEVNPSGLGDGRS